MFARFIPITVALVACAAGVVAAWPSAAQSATVFVVDTSSDANLTTCTTAPGDCSLRGAINQANAVSGADTINFNIPLTGGVHTIAVNSTGLGALPTVTGRLAIDGTTQPGYASRPIVELNGAAMTSFAAALTFDTTAAGSTVKGLVINRFKGSGIYTTADSMTIQGNYLGTSITGTVAAGNGAHGITALGAPDNFLIGGTTAATRNVIAANAVAGILLTGTGHVVQGNYIGTDATGTLDMGNGERGISLGPGTHNNCFGGVAPSCSPSSGAGNVVSGNGAAGIQATAQVIGNTIIGNYIGTSANGASPIPNNGVGVGISGDNQVIGAAGNGGGNVIAYNAQDGVMIPAGTGNSIRYNSIHSNGAATTLLGIDTDVNGVNPNDSDDPDTGGNNRQNYPLLNSAVQGQALAVTGSLNSTPNTAFSLDFYSNPACDTSGYGEGRTYLGTHTLTTGGGGDATFTAVLSVAVPVGHSVTATATRNSSPRDTSEFSACRTVTGGTILPPTATPSPTPTAPPTAYATPTPTARPSATPTVRPPSATPTPTLAATATRSPAPSRTPTPTPVPTPSPTLTPAPTPTSAPGELTWGDQNCSGPPDPIDSLLTLRHDARLPADTGVCPGIGEPVSIVGASLHPWGDVDCSDVVDPVDALKILRHDAGLPVDQHSGCPHLGDEVIVLG